MKDVTSTSFGLVIAYLLPGVVGIYAASFWIKSIRHSIDLLLEAKADPELLIVAAFAALIVGLVIHGVRYFIFETLFCKDEDQLRPADFVELAKERKLEAYRASVDEMYRYYQWWGGLAVVAPFVYIGWSVVSWDSLRWFLWIFSGIAFAGFEGLFIYVAVKVHRKYIGQAQHILGKDRSTWAGGVIS